MKPYLFYNYLLFYRLEKLNRIFGDKLNHSYWDVRPDIREFSFIVIYVSLWKYSEIEISVLTWENMRSTRCSEQIKELFCVKQDVRGMTVISVSPDTNSATHYLLLLLLYTCYFTTVIER